jgi:DNA polymerase-4
MSPKSPPRRIAHLDMDAFFASVELLRYPDLRGQPVVVGGRSVHKPVEQPDGMRRYFRLRDYVGRGVVTTSTYEARALGVFSAMGTMKAAKLAPDAILLPADFEAYRHYSSLFKKAVRDIAPLIEDRGIDEIYIDLSHHPEETLFLAQRIKNAVRAATQLTCSICVSENKLLAKMGSELDKPDGLTILTREDIPTRIWPLSVAKVNGIGPKTAARLHELNILTVGDLAKADPLLLHENFGAHTAEWLHSVANGEDDRPLSTGSAAKSISRETTFERDLHARHDRELLTPILTQLCTRLAADLNRKGYVARTIGIKLRYTDFRRISRDHTLPAPTADPAVIRRAAGECLRRVDLEPRFRLLGVKASGLIRQEEVMAEAAHQWDLFDEDPAIRFPSVPGSGS